MRNFLIFLGVFLFSTVLSVHAQANKRFPQSKITASEWQQYFDEIKATPDAKIQEGQIQTQIAFIGPDKNEIYYFTNPNHPAHPAAIRVTAYVNNSGETTASVTGNYAGSKEDFDPWFKWAVGLVNEQKSKR